MDQNLINWIFTLAGALAGWVLKVIWDAIGELKRDLRDIEQDLPLNYVQKEDFKDVMVRIESMFTRIFDKLEGKADK